MEKQIRAYGVPEILASVWPSGESAGPATGVSAGSATGGSAGPAPRGSSVPDPSAGSNPGPSAGSACRGWDSLEREGIPGCPRCHALDKALDFAFLKLRQAEGRIEGYETLYREAAERSCARIGAYNALYTLHDRRGMPFVDGAGIHPRELIKFPRHPQDDRIRKAILNKIVGEAAGLDSGPELDVEALEAAVRDSTKEGSKRRPGSPASSTKSQESEESIPSEFLPGESEDSDNSEDDSSEPDQEWELDPDMHSNSDGVGLHSEGEERSDAASAEESGADSAERSGADSAEELGADSAEESGVDSAED